MEIGKRISYNESHYQSQKRLPRDGQVPFDQADESPDDNDSQHYIEPQDNSKKIEKQRLEKINKEKALSEFAPEGWKTEVLPLFSTPLFICNPKAIPQEELSKLLSLLNEKECPDFSSHAGFKYLTVSNDKQILSNPEISIVSKNIVEALRMYLDVLGGLAGHFFIKTSWIVKSRPGDKARTHTHPNSLFSGVYYIQTDPACGDIIFEYEKSMSPAICTNMDLERRFGSIFNSQCYSHTPKNNQILLFPSNLRHRVAKNKSTIDRISIAFDIYVDGTIGVPPYGMETKFLGQSKKYE